MVQLAEPEPSGDERDACRGRCLGPDGQEASGIEHGDISAEDDLVADDGSAFTVSELPAGEVDWRQARVHDLDEVGRVAEVLVDRDGRRGRGQRVRAAGGGCCGLREGADAVGGACVAGRGVRVDRKVDIGVDDRRCVGAEQADLVGPAEAEAAVAVLGGAGKTTA